MPVVSREFDELAINTIRFLAVDGVQKANSGHPGMPMGCAPIGYTLFAKYMNYNPSNPKWYNRDRFVLSAGHGSMLLYSLLHLTGFEVSLDDLKSFRQFGSITPGHPEYHLTPGVETTTGPLGQGFANAVGMAIAQKYLSAKFNKDDIKIIDHHIYGICSDGDLMEGVSHEAASLAGHLKLGNLIFFYDDNDISIDGSTDLSFTENVGKRFEAYNWHVQHIEDVNDIEAIENAIKSALKDKRPSIIVTRTHIGYGSPNKQDTAEVHGSPLGEEEVKLTKKNLGWPEDEKFLIPDKVMNFFDEIKRKGEEKEENWNKLFNKYKEKYPGDAKLFIDLKNGNYGDEWKSKLPVFKDEGKKVATRAGSGKVLNAIASSLPGLIGGSADLAPSNNTMLKDYPVFSSENYGGRNFHFGVREHGMASILTGMALYGGVIPYGGTFLIFSDYLRPAIRLASLSGVRPIYVFTHDSIGLGEDGPTHQPVEHLSSLRAIPKAIVIRPADVNETAYAWQYAIEHKGSPVALILTRQGLLVLDQEKYPSANNLLKGAYILKDAGSPEIILMASGSEVGITLKAAEKLETAGVKVRVVSFPSWELFEQQSSEYKEKVLPSNIKARVSVEAGVKHGWERYLGDFGEAVSIERFGASAPVEIVMEKYGYTPDNISETARRVLAKLEKVN
ncbi:MAG: transketolase [Ignavibacteria bacterium RBG_16_34_14]|nr:MAG: transketolase [Ignavibacteria bacterium RBG_16_34_14]